SPEQLNQEKEAAIAGQDFEKAAHLAGLQKEAAMAELDFEKAARLRDQIALLRSRSPDLEAEIVLLPTAEGGRQRPAFSGYNPLHTFQGDERLHAARHLYRQVDPIAPGETVTALLWFSEPGLLQGQLSIGRNFVIQERTAPEGFRVVGRGWV